ncbi:anti-repressor SinI family protein [Bacillus infantis]|uniref:DNA-binding anti-repressor SinI n=1 Tax=Bacillus infantis TaxID=324767 RepID=A0A5D4RLS5_9BACI|nr:anti-repressor SinI family protein [Bacillus infantis]TYS51940.1 DNA-binding anti-repressor SinI [Bacillus infantis]
MGENAQIDPEWRLLIQQARHLGLTKEEVRRFIKDSNSSDTPLKIQQAKKLKQKGVKKYIVHTQQQR